MNAELKAIKSAVGDIPKAQKQDKTQQACADMCASTGADNIIKIRKEIAKRMNGDEDKAADYLNNLMSFQSESVKALMETHKQNMCNICAGLYAQNVLAPDIQRISRMLDMSVVYNILLSVEQRELKLKMDPIASRMLEVMRSAKYFATIDFGNMSVKVRVTDNERHNERGRAQTTGRERQEDRGRK